MIAVIGLGPAGLDRLSPATVDRLLDERATIVVRTLDHPAAAELAARRSVLTCDDLYATFDDFDDVYNAIVDRVFEQAKPVIYAVPGSASVGERAVQLIREREDVEVLPGESFLDLVFSRVGIDPLADGLRVLDARNLPFPLILDGPVVIGQVDHALVAGDLKVRLLDQLAPETSVWVLSDLGGGEEHVSRIELSNLDQIEAGLRTTIAIKPEPVGWPGLVRVVTRLRAECPWDREQTHQSLVRYMVEEAYEVIEAISRLPADPTQPTDPADHLDLEDELGDVLLQVLLHAEIASESAGFTIDDVVEQQRLKLIRRHPHVFGDVDASSPADVEDLWADRKAIENPMDSLMDGVPAMPPLARADKVQRRAAKAGFDWPDIEPVYEKIQEEISELREAPADSQTAELGDLLFSVVNLARHLGIDSDLALSGAVNKFMNRFRLVESAGPMEGLSLTELDERWEAAKTVD
ncbi:MAG: nucleoside triphosphate pyrophosphohydrolase [Acidimicrobiia bacterium]|nr:nucleoside triphosphate pyrophosphohydrolase [Acidimicrobiia bacterium]